MKLLLKDAEPTIQTVALDDLKSQSKYGKINIKVLYVLFKVVIDDTLYEISGVMDYTNYLRDQIKRLKKIEKYDERAQKSKKDKDKDYFHEYMRLLFEPGENFDNYKQVAEEYVVALKEKEESIKRLYQEIDIIKKLKQK